MIPCSCNLALGGAGWYLCVRGLSASTALQELGLARGCPPCLRRRRLPAVSNIGEGILPGFGEEGVGMEAGEVEGVRGEVKGGQLPGRGCR